MQDSSNFRSTLLLRFFGPPGVLQKMIHHLIVIGIVLQACTRCGKVRKGRFNETFSCMNFVQDDCTSLTFRKMGIIDQRKIKESYDERIINFESLEIARLAHTHPDHALSPLFIPTQRFKNKSPCRFTLRVIPQLKIISKNFQSSWLIS